MQEHKSFSEKVAEISQNNEMQFSITGRELFNALGFERRTRGNCNVVDNYLETNDLMVEPHYNDVWIDNTIILKHKPKAKTRLSCDPILKVRILQEASRVPVFVNNDDSLEAATTLMRLHDYSQLPVTTNKQKGLCGYISWKTIGVAQANGVNTGIVKDYKQPVKRILKPDTPMLDAVRYVYENEFALVEDNAKSICGIITTTDISNQFLTLTEPFLLMEEIEGQIRLLLNDKILLEEIKKCCIEPGRNVDSIDDLTFGEYVRLFQNDANWKKIGLPVEKKIFLRELDNVRNVRNDIMHFEPDGISPEQHKTLVSMSNLLKSLMR